MGPGDELNGYRLTTPFTTTGGGHCQWAFASRGGEEYFVKQFLNPTYPLPDGPGSEKTKAAKRARCERFAKQHTEVAEKLRPLSATGGNLVVTRDFFRHAAHYYKVTVKVDAGTEGPPEIAALPLVFAPLRPSAIAASRVAARPIRAACGSMVIRAATL